MYTGRRTSAKCATTTEDDVREETLPQVEVDTVDRVYDNLVYTCVFLTDQLGVEQDLRCTETLWPKLDNVQYKIW